jgi:hypothetical protein
MAAFRDKTFIDFLFIGLVLASMHLMQSFLKRQYHLGENSSFLVAVLILVVVVRSMPWVWGKILLNTMPKD